MNFLLVLTILIPIINVLAIVVKYDSNQEKNRIIDFFSKVAPIAFFIILIGLFGKHQNNSLQIVEFNSVISLGFKAAKSTFTELFVLAVLWIIFIFYSEKFLLISGQNSNKFKLFLAIAMSCLNLIILAENLTTMLFFYDLFLLFFIFLFSKSLLKKDTKSTYIFIFLIIFEAILLFLVIIMLSQFSSEISFNKNGVIITASKPQTLFIISLFFAAILTAILSSSYLLLKNNLNFESLKNYLAFPLFMGLAKIFIFSKIIVQIFGIGLFSSAIPVFLAQIIEFFFMINILLSLSFMLFSRDFRAIFLHLFFNQLNFAFLTIFVFAFYDEGEISQVFVAFALVITLIFMAFSNLILYLKNAKNKDFTSLFYSLKVTISIMVFGLLCLIGVVPSLNMMQNFKFLQVAINHKSAFALTAWFFNSLGLILFTYKLFFVAFLKTVDNKDESDRMLADKIDGSSGMSLSGVTLCLIIFLLPILKVFYD